MIYTTISLLIALVAYAALRELAAARTNTAYESMIASLKADKSELLDRLFATKSLPPVGIDMKVAHEEKETVKRESAAMRKAIPRSDPLTEMRHKAVFNELKAMEEGKVSVVER